MSFLRLLATIFFSEIPQYWVFIPHVDATILHCNYTASIILSFKHQHIIKEDIMKKAAYLLVVTFVLGLVGCDSDKESDQEDEFLEFAMVETADAEFPLIINHEDGEHLVLHTNAQTNLVDSAVYFNGDEEAVIQFAENGLPTRGYMLEHTFLFDNYDGNTLDMAVIDPSGESYIFRDLVLEGYNFDQFRQPNDLGTALQAAGIGVGVFNCALGLALATGTGGLAFVLPAVSCGSTLLAIIGALDPNDTPTDAFAAGFSTYANTIGCVTGDAGSCIGYVIDISSLLVNAGDNHQDTYADTINATEAALMYGYGDIQVTLTWNNTSDLDLYVTDPFGETISYSNASSDSGGELDVDDVDGFGPENIFWLTGTAPQGQYVVALDHYSGPSPATFQIRVDVLGQVGIFNGQISAGEYITITNFTVQQPNPIISELMLVETNKSAYRPAK